MSQDFATRVLERSHALPVVVDFWAPWCAPCRTLGPVLDELAAQAAGRWELVKLDVDEHPEIASTHGVRGIPAVKMFHRGAVLAEFVGAQPAEQIRQWLAEHLPDPRLAELQRIVDDGIGGDRAELVSALERFVAAHPDLAPGRLRLARAIVAEQPARARELVRAGEPDAETAESAADIDALAELMEGPHSAPERLAEHFDGARAAFRRDDFDAALEHLVDAAMIDKRFADELARRAAVSLFRLLGRDHELTRKHQRRLGMALHT